MALPPRELKTYEPVNSQDSPTEVSNQFIELRYPPEKMSG